MSDRLLDRPNLIAAVSLQFQENQRAIEGVFMLMETRP
jgi:hypothetical protein